MLLKIKKMDSIVEENGNSNNVDGGGGRGRGPAGSNDINNLSQQSTSSNSAPPSSSVNVVQYLPTSANAAAHNTQVQSVIQAANQSSVIQTAAANAPPVAMKSGVLYVSKPNTTVIHTTSGNAVKITPNFPCKIKPEPHSQHLDTNSEDSFTDEDSPRSRRELTRRPSYHKIFNDISGPDISDNSVIAEDQTRKREIRLQKNREAARECRRKKKEYIKCLENRVAVLENQNKALIEELKSLKELYCQTKNDWVRPEKLPAEAETEAPTTATTAAAVIEEDVADTVFKVARLSHHTEDDSDDAGDSDGDGDGDGDGDVDGGDGDDFGDGSYNYQSEVDDAHEADDGGNDDDGDHDAPD